MLNTVKETDSATERCLSMGLLAWTAWGPCALAPVPVMNAPRSGQLVGTNFYFCPLGPSEKCREHLLVIGTRALGGSARSWNLRELVQVRPV